MAVTKKLKKPAKGSPAKPAKTLSGLAGASTVDQKITFQSHLKKIARAVERKK